MEINYANKTVKKQCTFLKQARKDFPEKVAKKLLKLINFIEDADNLGEVMNYPSSNFHNLKGNKEGLYSLDVDGRRSSYRLIVSFENLSNEIIFSQSMSVKMIEIKEVSKHYE